MPNTLFEVNISSISPICEKSQIYQINFSLKGILRFKGYETLAQLGRFYYLTINNKVTRLYTAVNFLA